MSICAILPIKHKSSRIPGKNYRDFNGKPLFTVILDTLIKCKIFNEIIIDTNSEIVKDIVKSDYNNYSIRIYDRPEHLWDGDIPMNIILEKLDEKINEKLFYSLLNIIDLDNKFIIVTSKKPIVDINFSLTDLKSRTKNFLLQKIEKPDDELMFALILKNLSDRQISIDKKLINFIIKRIHRSYDKIFDFIYKIDELSLKRKKPIDFKIIKEVLGE